MRWFSKSVESLFPYRYLETAGLADVIVCFFQFYIIHP